MRSKNHAARWYTSRVHHVAQAPHRVLLEPVALPDDDQKAKAWDRPLVAACARPVNRYLLHQIRKLFIKPSEVRVQPGPFAVQQRKFGAGGLQVACEWVFGLIKVPRVIIAGRDASAAFGSGKTGANTACHWRRTCSRGRHAPSTDHAYFLYNPQVSELRIQHPTGIRSVLPWNSTATPC